MPDPAPIPAPVEIGLMIYPQCQLASVHGLGDMFAIANLYAADHGGPLRIRTSHWQNTPEVWTRSHDSHPGAPPANPAVLIVPGRLTPPMGGEEAAPYAAWLNHCHAGGTVIASVCVGAFLLGHGGLLAGRRATTHWHYIDQFSAAFPAARLTPEAILVEDGDILTAAGMMA